MNAIAIGGGNPIRSPFAVLGAIDAEGRRRQPLLWGAAVFMLLLVIPTLAAYLLDARTVNDINVWSKPLKFQGSLALYLGTLAWFWTCLSEEVRNARWLNRFALLSVILIFLEVVYIVLQSARGTGSHFNVSTPVEGIIFTLMGMAALVFTAFAGALGIAIARRPAAGAAPAYLRAVVTGLILTSVLGIVTGAAIAMNGGHWVGAPPTDAGGLPIVGWTRAGGDLRAAHFFGLHALQILPVFGWLVARRRPGATAVISVVAVGFGAFTLWTLAEALIGRPFLGFVG